MRTIYAAIVFSLLGSCAHALVPISEYYGETAPKFAAIADTASVIYYSKCTRQKINSFEWNMWEGYYNIRAYLDPIAVITVEREPEEAVQMDYTPFILKAIQESARIGGNVLCYVGLKKDKNSIGFEKVTFRAYRQFFQTGHTNWKTYLEESITKGPAITLEDFQNLVKQNK